MSNLNSIKILFFRNLKKNFRVPMWLVMGLLQPVLYIVLYMPLLEKTGSGFSNSQAQVIRMFVPGMLVTIGMGGFFSGFGFIDEMRQGIISRWLVSPISRSGIMLSVIFNHVITGSIQVAILLIMAFLFGLEAPLYGIILSFLLVSMLAICTISFSHIISIKVKEEHILAAITQTAYLPMMLLSGVMLPISLAPSWIQKIALFNPFYYVVEASRALFAGTYSESIILQGFFIMLISSILSVMLAIRTLKNMAN